MAQVDAQDVRIPRWARDAVARHEPVVVVSHDRPVVALVHPDDVSPPNARRRGRPVRQVAAELMAVTSPDPAFADDMEAVIASVGTVPPGPWAPS